MKTKSYIAIFILMNLFTSLKAQSYFPFPTGDATWQVTRCFYFFSPGWYDDYQIHMTGEDTVINNITYKKLYFTAHHTPGYEFDTIYPTVFLGGLYEAEKKVYIVSEYLCLDTMARVVYDFNHLNVGDTIYSQLLSPGSTGFIPHIVTSSDSVLIGSDYHLRLQLTNENQYAFEEWIEGVGSNNGLIYATYWLVTDNSYDLICFSENKQNEYLNPNPGFGFCTAPLPPVECDSLATGIENEFSTGITLFPNPASVFITVRTSGEVFFNRYIVKEMTGQVALTSYSKEGFTQGMMVMVGKLSSGLYSLELYADDRLITTYKLIKIN
jgi:hypothetical protein